MVGTAGGHRARRAWLVFALVFQCAAFGGGSCERSCACASPLPL